MSKGKLNDCCGLNVYVVNKNIFKLIKSLVSCDYYYIYTLVSRLPSLVSAYDVSLEMSMFKYVFVYSQFLIFCQKNLRNKPKSIICVQYLFSFYHLKNYIYIKKIYHIILESIPILFVSLKIYIKFLKRLQNYFNLQYNI